MTSIPVILLAAGTSSRMGGKDKLLQPVDGIPLLRRTALRALSAGPLWVALPPSPHPRFEALAGLDLNTVAVPDRQEGMNASLRRAIAALPVHCHAAMVLLADLPDLTAEDLTKVLNVADQDREHLIWRGTTDDGAPGHPVIFHSELFPELLALTGDGGAQSVVERHRDATCFVPLAGKRARLDLDTPEAWESWQKSRS
ncbi:NTP transferase domain-containing protein [Lutimaribacter marinistellae]|uniref:NTP transferase domain-containing protein n=1 Tax=Lutimaribacter marinistellae TaxID=1820329 RepID=A0ABV7TN59_9RHOB